MKKLFRVLIGVLMSSQAMADENDFRCFRSADPKSSLRLQFVFQTGKEGSGYVIYQKGGGPIAIKLLKEKELHRGPSGRPSEIEATWRETSLDGSGGTYIVVSQGALISKFRYIRKKDGKNFLFEEDAAAANENGCVWKID
jgi:hypothetical protein